MLVRLQHKPRSSDAGRPSSGPCPQDCCLSTAAEMYPLLWHLLCAALAQTPLLLRCTVSLTRGSLSLRWGLHSTSVVPKPVLEPFPPYPAGFCSNQVLNYLMEHSVELTSRLIRLFQLFSLLKHWGFQFPYTIVYFN